MAATQKIKLTSGVIHSAKLITKTPLTIITCTSKFDQITAEAMDAVSNLDGHKPAGGGIKETIYNSDGIMRGGVSEWKPDLEMFGTNVTFMPHQKDLFGDRPLALGSIKFEIEKVLRQDSDTSLKMNFKVTVPGYPRDLLDFCEAGKKGECSVIIEKASKAGEEEAKTRAIDFGLWKQPKAEDEAGEPKNEADDEPPPDDPAENDEADMPIEEVEQVRELVAEAVTGSLPSMREMGGRPKLAPQRGRGRRHIPRGGTLPD